MDSHLFAALFQKKLISQQEYDLVELQKNKPLSVHWELITILYLGIILFTTAVGILIYKNIDTIGHQALLILIAALCVTCFGYCFKYSKGYYNTKIHSPNVWFDYVLLTGCLLLLTFTGYIQFQYNIFGNRWGLALFIPMVVLFIAAYYFDHIGVLSLAIINLAAWAGITVTPTKILQQNDFNKAPVIYTGVVLGGILIAASFLVQNKNIKAHFAFTYKNFGAHILFISLLALMFHFESKYFVFFILFAAISFLFLRNAVEEKSFYFVVITILYMYIALSYLVVRLLSTSRFDTAGLYAGVIYFIVSGIGLIRLFIYYNKTLSKNAGL